MEKLFSALLKTVVGKWMVPMLVLLALNISARAELVVTKAYCGAEGSWKDATSFLQNNVKGDTLSLAITQPFSYLGGDPAPLKSKLLLVEYELNGESFELLLHETYPVAFNVRLPSPEAEAAGKDAKFATMMADAKSQLAARRAGSSGLLWRRWMPG